jgi:hypothetical protein
MRKQLYAQPSPLLPSFTRDTTKLQTDTETGLQNCNIVCYKKVGHLRKLRRYNSILDISPVSDKRKDTEQNSCQPYHCMFMLTVSQFKNTTTEGRLQK